jgi:FtsP/CotA-like multicopper oxidase with cupredoxin domain
MHSRRDVLRASLLASGALLLPRWAYGKGEDEFISSASSRLFPSPFLRPFATDLPLPPVVRPANPFGTLRSVPMGSVYHEIRAREGMQQVHPDLPPTRVWGYEDVNGSGEGRLWPGPTFVSREGVPMLARFRNELDPGHVGFGVPTLAVHRHGGDQAPEDDGHPVDYFRPGEHRDYYWPEMNHFGDAHETQSLLWYHDHVVDFTAQNVYRGLAGFFIRYSERDPGDERDPRGLRLPSAPYDIGLAFQDRRFGPDGQLVYDSFDHDGFLGDTFLVNGAVQPVLRVKRRKYRFRLLCGSNARYFDMYLSSGQPWIQIGTEGGLHERPIQRRGIYMAPGERYDVIVDFSSYPNGAEIVVENRLEQVSGRKPKGPAPFATPMMKFIVDGDAPDESRVPLVLRPPILEDPFPPAVRRTIEWNRSKGAWTVNGELWDEHRIIAEPRLGEVEVWTMRNSSGGWAHPVHVHGSLSRILRRNGRPPEPWDSGMRDMVNLNPNDEVDVRLNFQSFRGTFVFHCHNVEHEDLAMMAQLRVV